MKYSELPKTIVSPITGDILTLEEEKPNDYELIVAQPYDTCTEYYDGNLAQYTNANETIYIVIDDE